MFIYVYSAFLLKLPPIHPQFLFPLEPPSVSHQWPLSNCLDSSVTVSETHKSKDLMLESIHEDNVWCLSFWVWVTSVNIMFPSSIYVSENFIRFSLDMDKILLCIGTFHYSFISL